MPSKVFPGIPEPNRSVDGMFEPLQRVKEICEILTGQRGNSAAILAGADLDDVIAYANTQLKLKAPLTANNDNIIVNGGMWWSQENGFTASGANGYYPADTFRVIYITSTGVISSQLVASVTPKGSLNRLRVSCTVADTSIAAGEYCLIQQLIEGIKTLDLAWGTAAAKPLIVRFGFKGPAGTYCVACRNSGTTRGYVREFTISAGQANMDTEQKLIFPGDTSGTWLKDTSIGIEFDIALMAGSGAQGTPNVWGVGIVATSNQINGLGVNTNVFELFDVGAYPDTSNTGVDPAWKAPNLDLELMKCKRYWQRGAEARWQGLATSGILYAMNVQLVGEMRIAPTITQTNTLNSSFPATPNNTNANTTNFYSYRTANATGQGHFIESWTADARL